MINHLEAPTLPARVISWFLAQSRLHADIDQAIALGHQILDLVGNVGWR